MRKFGILIRAWLHECIYVSKFTELYTDMCILFYVGHFLKDIKVKPTSKKEKEEKNLVPSKS